MVDLGTGNNNKINWALDDKQEMIDLVEVKQIKVGYLCVQL
jgi:DIM1 family U5 snRNP protein